MCTRVMLLAKNKIIKSFLYAQKKLRKKSARTNKTVLFRLLRRSLKKCFSQQPISTKEINPDKDFS